MRKYRLLLLPLFAISLAGACPKVEPSDKGAPTLAWSVRDDASGKTEKLPANASMSTKLGGSYTVTFKAMSAGGVKKIQLAPSEAWSCQSGSTTNNAGPGLIDPIIQTESPDSDGKVLTELFLIHDVGTVFDCNPGHSFKAGIVTLSGMGENFFSKVSKATLKIEVEP